MDKVMTRVGFAAFFAVCLFWVARQQAGEVYLKSGRVLYERNDPAATGLLESAARLDGDNYLAHVYHAAAIQKELVLAVAKGEKPVIKSMAARAALEKASAARFDPSHAELAAQAMLATGDVGGALENYNVSFFFGIRPPAGNWAYLRAVQEKAAEGQFVQGNLGVALIMALNHFSNYIPFAPQNATTGFIEGFLMSTPPESWRIARVETGGPELKKRFAALPPVERSQITATLKDGGFGFLAAYLGAK